MKHNFQRTLTMEFSGCLDTVAVHLKRKSSPYRLGTMWWILMWKFMQSHWIKSKNLGMLQWPTVQSERICSILLVLILWGKISTTYTGFSFHIDTGNHPYICWKPPRYGPHETKLIQNMVGHLDENYVVEDDNRPWVELFFIAGKHISKFCHGRSIIGDSMCPAVNWTSSLAYFTSPCLTVIMQCKT